MWTPKVFAFFFFLSLSIRLWIVRWAEYVAFFWTNEWVMLNSEPYLWLFLKKKLQVHLDQINEETGPKIGESLFPKCVIELI